MCEQVLKVTRQLPAGDRDAPIVRLDRVRTISLNLGHVRWRCHGPPTC